MFFEPQHIGLWMSKELLGQSWMNYLKVLGTTNRCINFIHYISIGVGFLNNHFQFLLKFYASHIDLTSGINYNGFTSFILFHFDIFFILPRQHYSGSS